MSENMRVLGILLHQLFLVLGHHVGGDFYADLSLAGRVHGRRPSRMRVVRLAVIVLPVIVLAFKCLRFSGLGLFRLLLRSRVLRIVYCVAFCCVIQVISLSVPTYCLMLKDTEKMGISGTYPKQSVYETLR